MFNLGQTVSLESFPILLVVFFPIEISLLSKNRAVSRNLNHYSKCREQNKNSQTILDIIFGNFGTFQKIFDSPQVNWDLISSLENIVYDWPHKLPDDLKLQNLKKLANTWVGISMSNLPSKNKMFVKAVKNSSKLDIKVLCFCPVLVDFFTLFQLFCPGF